MSPIAQITGMEPVRTSIIVHPFAGSIPGRNVEGFYLLTSIPPPLSNSQIEPMSFVIHAPALVRKVTSRARVWACFLPRCVGWIVLRLEMNVVFSY